MGESPAVELRRAPSGAKRSSFAPEEHETRGVAIFYSPSRLRLWNAFLTLKSGTLLIQIKNVVLIYAVLSLGVFMVFYSSAKGCGFLVYERAAMDARAEVDGDVADYDSDGDEAKCLRWIEWLMRMLAPCNEVYQTITLLASFLLSMYVSQALTRYFKYLDEGRALQRAIYDFCFSVRPHVDVSHAGAHEFLTTTQRYLGLAHIYVWARIAPFQVVEEGFAASDLLAHLTETDFMGLRVVTAKEAAVLARFSEDQVHIVLLAWVSELVKEAHDADLLELEAPNYAQVQDNLNKITSAAMRILATADTLVPHVYAQMMQVSVDAVCVLAAFSATYITVKALLDDYPVVRSLESVWLPVFAVGSSTVQTIFYQGFVIMANDMMHPFDRRRKLTSLKRKWIRGVQRVFCCAAAEAVGRENMAKMDVMKLLSETHVWVESLLYPPLRPAKAEALKRVSADGRAGNDRWNGPVQQNFKPLYLGPIDVVLADIWTDRFLSSSSFQAVTKLCRNRSDSRILKSCRICLFPAQADGALGDRLFAISRKQKRKQRRVSSVEWRATNTFEAMAAAPPEEDEEEDEEDEAEAKEEVPPARGGRTPLPPSSKSFFSVVTNPLGRHGPR